MQYSKVTRKYQVTIPKEVREQVEIRAGEVVMVEPLDKTKIVIKRFPKEKDPLSILVGRKQAFKDHIPVGEIEERLEERQCRT